MRHILWLFLLLSFSAQAVIETYEFDNEEQHQRYQRFIDELRCPKCQNQNLSGSNSTIAEDLRRELYRLLQEGRSDDEIIEFMVSRYGDFILYRPRFQAKTALLWFSPLLFLLIGLGVLFRILKRAKQASVANANAGLSEVEQQQLDELLNNPAARQNDNKE